MNDMSTHTSTKAQKCLHLQIKVKGYDRFTIPGFIQCSSSESHHGSCLQRRSLQKSSLEQARKVEVFFRSKVVTYT